VLGKDRDIGSPVTSRGTPRRSAQPIYNLLLALLFEWGAGLHDLDLEKIRKLQKDPKVLERQLRQLGRKVRRQVGKDYLIFPGADRPVRLPHAGGQRRRERHPEPAA
jgi:NADPH-dependent stearoyl-CoA 9-desaturase